MSQDSRLLEILGQIADMASTAVDSEGSFEGFEGSADGESDGALADDAPGCVIKSVPKRLVVKAAEIAAEINPVNRPAIAQSAALSDSLGIMEPLQIAVLTAKYWGPALRTLSVSFMETTPADLKARIISHLNAWANYCGIRFAATNGTGDVRISRGAGGYWSYLGTDILLIPKNRQTMNLQSFTMTTPESEYKRVVRHECGHTLGFPHEHARKAIVARIDPAKAYKWFWDTYHWDKATVDAQVLTPLNEKSLMGTPADQTSIMCYQLPGSITKDGKPIIGGTDINRTDGAFAATIYPKKGRTMMGAAPHEEEWSEADDVEAAIPV